MATDGTPFQGYCSGEVRRLRRLPPAWQQKSWSMAPTNPLRCLLGREYAAAAAYLLGSTATTAATNKSSRRPHVPHRHGVSRRGSEGRRVGFYRTLMYGRTPRRRRQWQRRRHRHRQLRRRRGGSSSYCPPSIVPLLHVGHVRGDAVRIPGFAHSTGRISSAGLGAGGDRRRPISSTRSSPTPLCQTTTTRGGERVTGWCRGGLALPAGDLAGAAIIGSVQSLTLRRPPDTLARGSVPPSW
jgi:hypothetical protein